MIKTFLKYIFFPYYFYKVFTKIIKLLNQLDIWEKEGEKVLSEYKRVLANEKVRRLNPKKVKAIHAQSDN